MCLCVCYVVALFVLVLCAVGWCVSIVIFVACCVLLVWLIVFGAWFLGLFW